MSAPSSSTYRVSYNVSRILFHPKSDQHTVRCNCFFFYCQHHPHPFWSSLMIKLIKSFFDHLSARSPYFPTERREVWQELAPRPLQSLQLDSAAPRVSVVGLGTAERKHTIVSQRPSRRGGGGCSLLGRRWPDCWAHGCFGLLTGRRRRPGCVWSPWFLLAHQLGLW